jgi:ubiquinone/menaquinone biosynthesis C-methylase UbiE
MSQIVGVFLTSTIVIGIAILIWWLLIATEGVYLGRRVVVWLYDLYASRYDRVKNYDPEYEQLYLAEPMMKAVAPERAPLVLDVATGTGRLPVAVARHPDFEGRIIGTDMSRRMLHFAARNVYPYNELMSFIWCPAEALPFPDGSFDIVTCLEALEFMENPEGIIKELVRVLCPGGLLLISQRINTKWMPGKTWTGGETLDVLENAGIVGARAEVWQVDYRKVWGRKAGHSRFVGVRSMDSLLWCPHCHQGYLKASDGRWLCETCQCAAKVAQDAVIELLPLY